MVFTGHQHIKLHVQNYPSNLKVLQKAVVLFQHQILNSEFPEWCISLLKVSTGDVFLMDKAWTRYTSCKKLNRRNYQCSKSAFFSPAIRKCWRYCKINLVLFEQIE